MKLTRKFIIAISVLLFINACSSGGGVVPSVASSSANVVELQAVENYSVPAKSDYNIELTLKNEFIDSTLMHRESPVRVRFTVWGYDQLLADVAATKIESSEFSLRPQSVAYSLRFSKQDLQAVENQSAGLEGLQFYITLEVDVDGDGALCNGDYRQDHSASRPEFYPVTRTDIERVIDIKEIQGELC